jgi:hypothetical protein
MRHWLEVINSCEALTAAVPGAVCVEDVQGRDLPAYRSSDNKVTAACFNRGMFSLCFLSRQVLLNANQFTLTSSCGSSHSATKASAVPSLLTCFRQRRLSYPIFAYLWPTSASCSACARAAPQLTKTACPLWATCSTPCSTCRPRAISSGSPGISCFGPRQAACFLFVSSQLQHPVLSLTRTPRSQQAKQPGEHTRLLSADAEDHLMATVNTHLAPAWDMVLLPPGTPPPPPLCSPACS